MWMSFNSVGLMWLVHNLSVIIFQFLALLTWPIVITVLLVLDY